MQAVNLRSAVDTLALDAATGRLLSLRPLADPDLELLASAEDHPAFVLQHLGPDGEMHALDSRDASAVRMQREDGSGGGTVSFEFTGVGGLDLALTLSVWASEADPCSRWRLRVRNGAGLRLVDVQFPFVVVPAGEEGAVLQPAAFGHLTAGAALAHLPADEPRRWQLIPENGSSPHYPGRFFAQFLAWYNHRGGVYLACEDTEANVKMLGAVRREPGLRLGLAHVGDWPTQGERELEYDVVLRSFTGDWYSAADLYREWTLRQAWAVPLTQRTDVPAWLLDSPPHITIRLQGYLDAGPAPAIEEFLPYEKCIPLLQGIADATDSPLVAVFMSWERGGPWVYPDCFPPVGGDESLARFTALARERGWHVGSFCNGTRWVVRHLYNDYDGWDYLRAQSGEQGICRQHNGELWAEAWDQSWRPSFPTCMGQQQTKDLAVGFVRRLVGWGMESIQFFDQNCNAATFPCFATDHGHPPIPGKWMAAAMREMIRDFRQVAQDAGQEAVIQSTEAPCNEVCRQLFQQSDLRVSPPSCGMADFIPVYHYIFHECAILHGMMSTGPEPHALPVRTAWNFVLGEISGAVMTGDGTLLNRDTFNWADWEPKVGSNQEALEMLRVVTAMRRGPGRDFLVYGRMQRPATVQGIETVRWEYEGRRHEVPAVAHAAWQSPEGRHGVAVANWTAREQRVEVLDPRLGPRAALDVCASEATRAQVTAGRWGFSVTLPPLSCAVLRARG